MPERVILKSEHGKFLVAEQFAAKKAASWTLGRVGKSLRLGREPPQSLLERVMTTGCRSVSVYGPVIFTAFICLAATGADRSAAPAGVTCPRRWN